MLSLDETFDQLLKMLDNPDALNPARADPLFYFLHRPDETLTLAQKLPVWIAKLENTGWTVEVASLATLMWEVIDQSGRWDQWVKLEHKYKTSAINNSVRDVLATNDVFVQKVAALVTEPRPHTVVLLKDTILVHPFFRARLIEGKLTNKIQVPTVLFYPGRRSGQFGLHFLDFYPVDGNYRSTIVGGTV